MESFAISHLSLIVPELVLLFFALGGLLVGSFQGKRFAVPAIKVALFAVTIVFFLTVFLPDHEAVLLYQAFLHNSFTQYSKLLILAGSAGVLFLSLGYYREYPHNHLPEFAVLILLATIGMMIMVSAQNLIVFYMALEMQSLALYILASLHRDDVRASEAGLKYFTLGAVASGILLYGCSLVYGFSGTIVFSEFASLYQHWSYLPFGVLVGVVCIIIGVAFKISAVPFHMWTPDVYQGTPIVVTAFFAVVPKVAIFAVLIRFLIEGFEHFVVSWQQIIIFLAGASMVVGAIGALRQHNIKRLIAYSSIGHVGYALTGLAAGTEQGMIAVMVYITIYVVMSFALFGCLMLLVGNDGTPNEVSHLSGLAKTHPLIALFIAIVMFSMAGIPPFAGFFGKFFVFLAAIEQGLIVLAVLGVLSSVIAAFYYLRIIKVMYMDQADVHYRKTQQRAIRLPSLAAALMNLFLFLFIPSVLFVVREAVSALF